MTEVIGEKKEKSHLRSLPSDYTDVQPKSYDPEFISEISNKMQVPERLSFGVGGGGGMIDDHMQWRSKDMAVPDRILVAGNEEHIGLKDQVQLDHIPTVSRSVDPYIGLQTPPRTLTSEETFPSVEDADESNSNAAARSLILPNGNGPLQYTPGDSLLQSDEDEAVLLRTHVAKLSRRIATIEQENQKRAQRELILYPLVFGYLMLKVVSWLLRNN